MPPDKIGHALVVVSIPSNPGYPSDMYEDKCMFVFSGSILLLSDKHCQLPNIEHEWTLLLGFAAKEHVERLKPDKSRNDG